MRLSFGFDHIIIIKAIPLDAPCSAQTQKGLPAKKILSAETLEMAINFLLFRGQLNMVESEHNSTKKEGEHRSCSILVAIVCRELNGLDGIANALTEPRYLSSSLTVYNIHSVLHNATAMYSVLLVSRVVTARFIT